MPVTFTAGLLGGGDFYEFRYLLRGPSTGGVNFVETRPYSTDPNWTWTPSAADIGENRIVVQMRAIGSLAPFELTRALNHTVQPAPPATGVTLSAAPTSPATAPATVVFTAAGQGGSGVYKYRFLKRAPGQTNFIQVQPYGSQNTWTWNALAGDAGASRVVVQVRRVGTGSVRDAQRGVDYTVNAP